MLIQTYRLVGSCAIRKGDKMIVAVIGRDIVATVEGRYHVSCLKFRRLSLLGNITVLKSLVASQLVSILTPLQANHQEIKEINKLCFHFLWNYKRDKIKRTIMINDYPEGGLKMIDIASF